MSTQHGSEVELYVDKTDAKITKEFIGTLDGGSADQDLYTKIFPITDSTGATTDTETDVDVFTDDGTTGSWTEYTDDGTDFEIVGSEGKVTIKSAENQAGNSGEKISISYYTLVEIGEGGAFSLDFSGDLTDIHKLGSRGVQEIKEGMKTFSGTIEEMWCQRDVMGLFLSEQDFYDSLSDFTIYLYPNGNTTGKPRISLNNAKFEGGSIEVDLDSIMMQDISFRAKSITVDTVP